MRIDNVNVGRRRFVTASCGLGIGALSGCCSFRPFPKQLLGSSQLPLTPRRILAPERVQRSALKPSFAVDVHAHFFNASDVNVDGFVRESFAHTEQEPLRSLIEAMAPVIDDLAGSATTAADEYAELLEISKTIGARSALEGARQLDDRINKRRDDIADALYKSMRKQGADIRYLDLKQKHYRSMGMSASAASLSPETIRRVLEPATALQESVRSRAVQGASVDPDGIVRFAGYMLQDRWMNLRTYMRAYSTDEGAFGIDAAFGALVDFDYWFDCPAHSSRQDQMKVQSLISLMSGGYMLPLISYNPWTDLKRPGESLQLVKDAINHYGFIGVKTYPPMGFYPYGNEANPIPSTKLSHPDPHQLDQALHSLFDWCIANGIPVMAHTSESLGRDCASDGFGGPIGWKALLDEYAASGLSPIVNLGHFGGDTQGSEVCGTSAEAPWPSAFANLMKRTNGNRVYGDLAYWTELRSCSERDSADCRNVLQRVEAAKAEFPALGKRTMYGTDWLMTSKEPDWPSYPQQVVTALKNELDLQAFFYTNAIDCFGLGASGSQRSKLEARFGINSLPDWLK